jgi:hypothetical protein
VTWWWKRDPDLSRDRATKALGRRDWNYFTPYTDSTGIGATPADIEAASTPWAGHPVTAHDRHDRTLGIPPRHVSMWPDLELTLDTSTRGGPDPLAAILHDLRTLPAPSQPPAIAAVRIAAALADLAGRAYARPAHVQAAGITQTARRHQLDPAELTRLARGVGEMIAKTSHRGTGGLPGEPTLNALAGANLELAAEIYLARAHLDRAAACSDPDLPRLWILANGLTHRVPAHVMLTQPARSAGPIARLRPLHDDLIGWHGIRAAVEHLDTVLQAVHTGRSWLSSAADTASNRLLALGLLDLTRPGAAYRLAGHGPAGADLRQIQGALTDGREPTTIAELTDPALKAVCDRVGWLHGTADERTHRELVERHTTTTGPAQRSPLARGDLRSLALLTADGPTDPDLDRSTWRDHPANPDAVHRRQLLNTVSREALAQFAGHDIQPHLNRAAALTARYPDRLAHHALRTPAAGLTTGPGVPPPPEPALPAQAELDLGR